jgi:hypothetical protein
MVEGVRSPVNPGARFLTRAPADASAMAIDAAFTLFLLSGGKRAFLWSGVLVGGLFGAILVGYGTTQSLKAVAGGANMVEVGGGSLLAMAVALVVAALVVRREIKQASAGTHEAVFDVAGFHVPEGGLAAGATPLPPQAPPQPPPPPPPRYAPDPWQYPHGGYGERPPPRHPPKH